MRLISWSEMPQCDRALAQLAGTELQKDFKIEKTVAPLQSFAGELRFSSTDSQQNTGSSFRPGDCISDCGVARRTASFSRKWNCAQCARITCAVVPIVFQSPEETKLKSKTGGSGYRVGVLARRDGDRGGMAIEPRPGRGNWKRSARIRRRALPPDFSSNRPGLPLRRARCFSSAGSDTCTRPARGCYCARSC